MYDIFTIFQYFFSGVLFAWDSKYSALLVYVFSLFVFLCFRCYAKVINYVYKTPISILRHSVGAENHVAVCLCFCLFYDQFDEMHARLCIPGAGRKRCFVCKAVDSEAMISCTDKLCRQLYHVTCLRSFLPSDEAPDERTFLCPMHQCATCQTIGKAVFAG